VIRLATAADVSALGPIEAAAQQRFRGTDLAAMADSDTLDPSVPQTALENRLLWVSGAGAPTGFLAARIIDDSLFITEVSVHPSCQGQRLGAALIDQAAQEAHERGLSALTLITDRLIPWNAPYYARLGFAELAPADLSPGLAQALADDHNAVITPARRCVMRRWL
jgi:GNAT superfamily N-acetyltransferase